MKNKKAYIPTLLILFLTMIFVGGKKVQAESLSCSCYINCGPRVTSLGAQACDRVSTVTSVSSEETCNTACARSEQGITHYVYGDGDNFIPIRKTASSENIATPTHFDYQLLEALPGFFNAKTAMNTNSTNDLPALILAIYKFGIWTVGIAGFFMLVVGGFMYMTSAGNTSNASNARGIIWDSLIGIVAALSAYLILYVINPDLIKINIAFTSVDVTENTETSPESMGTLSSSTDGSCSGLATQSGISSQCSVASQPLTTALSCIAGKLPSAVITSISDSKGYVSCTPDKWMRPPCAHMKYSCHYGGKNCFSTGKSYAADLSTRNLSASQIITAAGACGARYVDESGSANHIHVSVGQAAGCGCT